MQWVYLISVIVILVIIVASLVYLQSDRHHYRKIDKSRKRDKNK